MKKTMELAGQILLRFGKVDIDDMLKHPELYGDCAWELQAAALRLARLVLAEQTKPIGASGIKIGGIYRNVETDETIKVNGVDYTGYPGGVKFSPISDGMIQDITKFCSVSEFFITFELEVDFSDA